MAQRFLPCRPLSRKTSLPFSSELLISLFAQKKAMQYASKFYPPDKSPPVPEDWIPMELLLCGPGGISFEQAAQLLECTPAQVEENYRSARQQRATVRPTPEDKVNAVPKENFPVLWRWVAAGFAFVDLIAFAIAGGQFLWSHSFLNQKLAVPAQQKQRISLEDRFYQIQPPAGFRRISHRHSALYAQDDYINMDGQSLTFIQQVSSEQITGFNPDADFEQIPFGGVLLLFILSRVSRKFTGFMIIMPIHFLRPCPGIRHYLRQKVLVLLSEAPILLVQKNCL